MTESLLALTTGLFDYAGLFPPAALPLPDALDHDQVYRESEAAWMLGRFICPAAMLGPTAAVGPRPISVLAAASPSPDAFFTTLAQTLSAVKAASALGTLELDQVEIPVPAGLDADDLAEAHARCKDAGLSVFFETPRGEHPLFPTLASLGAGLKIRCGGVKAESFPSCTELAGTLLAAAQHTLPVKFTAGLHHPLRHHSASVNTHMHGFVNVYAAALFSAELHLDAAALTDVLAHETAASFGFDDEGLRLGAHFITTASIRRLRANRFFSYGTCSIEEPLADLHALGWL